MKFLFSNMGPFMIVLAVMSTSFLIDKNDGMEALVFKSDADYESGQWYHRNLNTTSFRNGDFIPLITSIEAWKEASKNGTPARCYVKDDSNLGSIYKYLYNGHAVMDPRGLASKGWHITTKAEWIEKIKSLGGVAAARAKLKAECCWPEASRGTNESGFNAMPAGWRNTYGRCWGEGESAYWWCSDDDGAYMCNAYHINSDDDNDGLILTHPGNGYSVRCVKD